LKARDQSSDNEIVVSSTQGRHNVEKDCSLEREPVQFLRRSIS